MITKLLHLPNSGQHLSAAEATEVFFGVTKLFSSDDAALRSMVYLFIKEMAETCSPDDTIVATSCLLKDFTCHVILFRARALRVLVRVIDDDDDYGLRWPLIESCIKNAITDPSGLMASSALVSSLHLFLSSPERSTFVRRWTAETTQAISNPNKMVQFHAIQLLHHIKSCEEAEFVIQYNKR